MTGIFFDSIKARILRKERRDIAVKIKECFDDVSPTNYTFACGGYAMANEEGETKFVAAGEIQKAIDNLNNLMADLGEKP